MARGGYHLSYDETMLYCIYQYPPPPPAPIAFPRSYKERRRFDEEMAELKTLRVSVVDMEEARKKDSGAWEQERSSLTSRLDEVGKLRRTGVYI